MENDSSDANALHIVGFRGKQGSSLGEASLGEKRQLAAFRPQKSFMILTSRERKRTPVALVSVGVHAPQSAGPQGARSPFSRVSIFEGVWPELPEQAATHRHFQVAGPFEAELKGVTNGALFMSEMGCGRELTDAPASVNHPRTLLQVPF